MPADRHANSPNSTPRRGLLVRRHVFSRPLPTPADNLELSSGWKKVELVRSYAMWDVTDPTRNGPPSPSPKSTGISAERRRAMLFGGPAPSGGPVFKYKGCNAMKTPNEATSGIIPIDTSVAVPNVDQSPPSHKEIPAESPTVSDALPASLQDTAAYALESLDKHFEIEIFVTPKKPTVAIDQPPRRICRTGSADAGLFDKGFSTNLHRDDLFAGYKMPANHDSQSNDDNDFFN